MLPGIQSARLSVESSALGPPTPSPARWCCSPPLWIQGGGHSLGGGGGGGDPIPTKRSDTLVLLYTIIPLHMNLVSNAFAVSKVLRFRKLAIVQIIWVIYHFGKFKKNDPNLVNTTSSLGRYVFGSEISYNKAPPRLPGLGC